MWYFKYILTCFDSFNGRRHSVLIVVWCVRLAPENKRQRQKNLDIHAEDYGSSLVNILSTFDWIDNHCCNNPLVILTLFKIPVFIFNRIFSPHQLVIKMFAEVVEGMSFLWACRVYSCLRQLICLNGSWSGQSREAVWLQLLTYMHSDGSNACYVNSWAIFSGNLCQPFCLGLPFLD